MQRFRQLIFLKMNSGQPVGRIITHDVVHGGVENGFYCPTGLVMHAITQLEVTQGKIGIVDMVIKSIELRFVEPVMLLYLGVESLERLEPEPLVCVIECLAEVKILQFLCRCGTRGQSGDQQESEPK